LQIEYAEFKGGTRWEKQVVDRSPVGANMYLIRFKYGNKIFPSIVYFDPASWSIKTAIKNGSEWIKNTLISKGIAGAHLFSDFLTGYTRGGLSYVRILDDGSYALYFSMFKLPDDILKIE